MKAETVGQCYLYAVVLGGEAYSMQHETWLSQRTAPLQTLCLP